MKLLTTLLLAVVFLTGSNYTFAKPNPVKVSTEIAGLRLSGFTSIKIGGPFDVHITQGLTESVKVDAPDEIMDRIVTEVDGNVLKIHTKHDNWGWGEKSWWSDKGIWHRRNGKKIAVYITAKDLSSITISGSGDIFFKEGITANSLNLKVRGSGSMEGKITVKVLESHISGSGNLKLSGIAENSTVKVSGSGNFTARDLVTVNSVARVSGSGHAEINASDKVNATVHGSAGVNYTGTAKIVTSKKSGSGEVSRF